MDERTKHPYRVFVSYSRENTAEAQQVRERLGRLGMVPVSDHLLAPGLAFSDEIKRHITFAHFFMPLVTESSSKRPWVHQEVGYALALGIPIIPLALEKVPEGFVNQIQSIVVKKDLRDLDQKMIAPIFDVAFGHASGAMANSQFAAPVFQCPQSLRQRTQMLADGSRDVRLLGKCGRVRLRAAFGPFTMPNVSASHPLWNKREGPSKKDGSTKRDDDLRELLRLEREEMEIHARAEGCRMILADDPAKAKSHSPEGTAVRLLLLKNFLESMADDKVDVAFMPPDKMDSNVVILGDWFISEAIVPQVGNDYRLTAITRHGPTVLKRIEDFDRQFRERISGAGLREGASRGPAIDFLEKTIRNLAPEVLELSSL